MDFDWSFRPILNWMRILGIELGHSEVNYSTLRRCGLLVLGLFMLTINIASNIIRTTGDLQSIMHKWEVIRATLTYM